MEQIINKYCKINNLLGNFVLIRDLTNLKTIPDNIIFCNIISKDYNEIETILDFLKNKLINGAILYFQYWNYNIHIINKNIRDIVKKWIEINNSEILYFNLPNNNIFEKSFIYRKNLNIYYEWSD